jgi:hypothetical protein
MVHADSQRSRSSSSFRAAMSGVDAGFSIASV